jgi:hypothetical protein
MRKNDIDDEPVFDLEIEARENYNQMTGVKQKIGEKEKENEEEDALPYNKLRNEDIVIRNQSGKYIYSQKENSLMISIYGEELFNFQKQMINTQKINCFFLKNHQIDVSVRTKMVDWMIEV